MLWLPCPFQNDNDHLYRQKANLSMSLLLPYLESHYFQTDLILMFTKLLGKDFLLPAGFCWKSGCYARNSKRKHFPSFKISSQFAVGQILRFDLYCPQMLCYVWNQNILSAITFAQRKALWYLFLMNWYIRNNICIQNSSNCSYSWNWALNCLLSTNINNAEYKIQKLNTIYNICSEYGS